MGPGGEGPDGRGAKLEWGYIKLPDNSSNVFNKNSQHGQFLTKTVTFFSKRHYFSNKKKWSVFFVGVRGGHPNVLLLASWMAYSGKWWRQQCALKSTLVKNFPTMYDAEAELQRANASLQALGRNVGSSGRSTGTAILKGPEMLTHGRQRHCTTGTEIG